jgi:hypothetical protein
MTRVGRALLTALLVPVAGCGGGGSSGPSTAPAGLLCDPNAQGIQLARPLPGATGVPLTTTTIEIVDDGNLDQLYSLTQDFNLKLVDTAGDQDATTTLVQVQDPTGPQPYGTSSYFYEGTLTQSLIAGRTYSVSLNATSVSCTPLPIYGTFST